MFNNSGVFTIFYFCVLGSADGLRISAFWISMIKNYSQLYNISHLHAIRCIVYFLRGLFYYGNGWSKKRCLEGIFCGKKSSLNQNNSFFYGVEHQADGIMEIKFLEDVVTVGINGANTDMEKVSNLLMVFSLGNKLENFTFAGC